MYGPVVPLCPTLNPEPPFQRWIPSPLDHRCGQLNELSRKTSGNSAGHHELSRKTSGNRSDRHELSRKTSGNRQVIKRKAGKPTKAKGNSKAQTDRLANRPENTAKDNSLSTRIMVKAESERWRSRLPQGTAPFISCVIPASAQIAVGRPVVVLSVFICQEASHAHVHGSVSEASNHCMICGEGNVLTACLSVFRRTMACVFPPCGTAVLA